jgi:hemerythrin superfamily protein
MTSAFDVLAKDHQEVEDMLAEFERLPTAADGAGPDQLAFREKMARQLVMEESAHEAVEEMYFWPAVREYLPDGDALADQAQRQEQEGKEVLDRLAKLSAGEVEFETVLAQFIRDGRAHIAFEEERVWPGMRAALTAEEAGEIGRKLEEGKEIAD